MTPFVTAGGAFLLSILYGDLMFDMQVVGHRERELPEEVLGSISRFYRRVTTDASPLNRIVAAVMAVTIGAVVVQIARADSPRWVGWASLLLVVPPVLLAVVRTFPSAVRLGARADTAAVQSGLARSIFRDHLACLTAIIALLTVQLAFGP